MDEPPVCVEPVTGLPALPRLERHLQSKASYHSGWGLVLQLAGPFVSSRFQSELGLHSFTNEGETQVVRVEVTGGEVANYTHPARITRRGGAVENVPHRRAYYADRRAVDDALLGRNGIPWPRGESLAELVGRLVEERFMHTVMSHFTERK
ncbi:MAG: hypothetical protein AB7K09_08350 [Planctomycetota bacterium]